MYRLGCDSGVYLKGKEWQRVGENKAWWISASKDALWIIDDETRRPFKYDQETK